MLIIAYYFPPLGGIGSIRAMKLATYLPDWGWQPTVLAPSTRAHQRDESLVYPESNVFRTRAFEISGFGKRVVGLGRSPASTAVPGFRAGLRRFAHRYLYYPDAQVGWYPFAVRAGRAALIQERFDAILSSSFPITAHLIARRLHDEYGIPWVAEFRDPWADLVEGARPGDRRDRLERSLLRDAGAVVTASPSWRDRFVEKGATRAFVVTNGFDPADFATVRPATGLVVTHLGSLYPPHQDLGAVWNALAAMRSRDPAVALRIRFVGEIPQSTRQELAGLGLADATEVTGTLPHREALAATAESTVLVAAGFRGDRSLHRGVVPAKLFEYLATGLPVVYVAGTETDAARLLADQPACHVVAPGDVAGALDALERSRREGRAARDLAPYTRRALAGRMAAVLDEVSAPPGEASSSR